MNDYIKREDAERLLRYDFLSALTEDERVDELNRIPSADVVGARHGHWEKKDDPYGYFDKIPVCSECGHTTELRKQYAYCPYCGAKMDGERKE